VLFGYIVCVSALGVEFVVTIGRETARPFERVGAGIKALSKTRARSSPFLVTSAITLLYKGAKADLMGVFLQI
jgi:hypothetical protein